MAPSHRTKPSPRALRLEALEPRELLTVTMTPQEQLMIELVNRARADPALEAARFGIKLNDEVEEDSTISEEAKQPLAPHQALVTAAGLHSDDMLRRNFFGHNTPEGVTPSDRAMAAGYPVGAGENIAWFGETRGIDRDLEVYQRHRSLVLSVGHRINMMRQQWREIGAGVRYGTFTESENGRFTNFDSIMVGTLFGSRGGDYFITGVAISDQVLANNFYEIGEGLGGVTITAVREEDGQTFTDVTGVSGGYGLQVPAGVYTVTAMGGRVSNPLTVRGVLVSDTNRKVDFNTLNMPTGQISGDVFHDSNRDGDRDPGEAGLPERTVYLDLNNNGNVDGEDLITSSDTDGRYIFQDLQPGQYAVRQKLPDGWTETAPGGTFLATLGGNNDVNGLHFGSRSLNQAPLAKDDVANVSPGASVVIDVLANDSDLDGSLEVASLQIVVPPKHGSITPNDAGQLVYTADHGFAGTDSFRYQVADNSGSLSNTATVQLTVEEVVRWQNPAEPRDVNGDDTVSSQDALIVIREINRHGPTVLAQRNLPTGPPYYDVNGDGIISSLDALQVIRQLNRAIAAQPALASTLRTAASTAADQVFGDDVAAAWVADESDDE